MLSAPLMALLALALAQEDGPRRIDVKLEAPVLGIDLVDLDGANLRELVVARPDGLHLQALGEPGEPRRFARGDWQTLAWCCARRPEGPEDVYLLADGGEVFRASAREGEPELVLADPAVTLPTGIFPLTFAQEFRGAGRLDLVLPHRNGLQLYYEAENGGAAFVAGPKIRHRPGASLRLPDGDGDPGEVVQGLRLPALAWRDQNGDGHGDLTFANEDLVQCFWTDASGELPEEPTFEIDLEDLRERLGVDMEDVDLSNVFAALEGVVTQELCDMDGDGHADLLLRQGMKVAVYRGTADGIDRSAAVQVLKTSGNLIVAFPADENGDGLLDLSLFLIEDVSLANLLVWVVVGGNLEMELFTYRQEAPLEFARRPSRQRKLTLDLPALRGIEDEMEKPLEDLERQLQSIPVPLDWDGDGRRDDAAFLRGKKGVIEIYLDLTPEEIPLTFEHAREATFRRYDRLAGGSDELEIELLDMLDWLPLYGRELIDTARMRQPSLSLDLPEDATLEELVLYRVDVDRNARDDLALLRTGSEDQPVELTFWLP